MALTKMKLWIVFSLLCVAVVVSLVMGVRYQSVGATTWQESDKVLGTQPLYRDSVEEFTLTLSSNGFSPKELTPNNNRFFLSIDNRTDLNELVLNLSDKHGNQVRELRVPIGVGDWSELLVLKSGKYVLSEKSHSAWSCTIVVP